MKIGGTDFITFKSYNERKTKAKIEIIKNKSTRSTIYYTIFINIKLGKKSRWVQDLPLLIQDVRLNFII